MTTPRLEPLTDDGVMAHDSMLEIERPYKGRLVIKQLGQVIGVVLGDAAVGWSARDALMHTIGAQRYHSEQTAIDAVLLSEA